MTIQYQVITNTQSFTVTNAWLSAVLNNWESRLDKHKFVQASDRWALNNIHPALSLTDYYRFTSDNPGSSSYIHTFGEQQSARRIVELMLGKLERRAVRGDVRGITEVSYKHHGDKLAFMFFVLPYIATMGCALRYLRTEDSHSYFEVYPVASNIMSQFIS